MCLKLYLLCLLAICGLVISQNTQANQNYSFAIDYDNNQFLLDGKPFQYVSGSFHYFRAPHQQWRDILRKMRAAGLNAVSTYVEWSMHEPEFDKWVWDGDADIIKFVEIAQEEDLLVLLRPGPYICAERDFGGFPYWLLTKHPDIKLRTRDERYIFYAERFLNQILTKVKPLLRGNGGPIIMVQVENEYGSFYSCDNEYKNKMYEVFDRHVGNKAVLFTTDGPTRNMLKCGTVPKVYGTVDFGSGTNVKYNFGLMKMFTPKGPLVNSEFYPGWLTHWGEKYQRVATDKIVKTFEEMMAFNASVNFYMFYGGTNFGFTSGANINNKYWPQLTSYDYDAPLTEAGDPTEKYFKIRESIAKYLPMPSLEAPSVAPKRDYGAVHMTPVLDLFTKEARETFGTPEKVFEEPPTFESLGRPVYLVLYETNLPNSGDSNAPTLRAITKDRALVYVDDELSAKMSRMDESYSSSLSFNAGNQLKLLVENLGRVNYGSTDVEDFKGIFNVTIDDKIMPSWRVTGYELASVKDEDFKVKNTVAQTETLSKGPQFLVGRFNIEGELQDSFLNTAGWGKGVAYMNGHNLGRYWPSMGPQMTLYVPKEYLRKGKNSLILLELENVPESRVMQFQVTSLLDYSNQTVFY